ncbi:MAG: PAS domain-containing protein [Parafilimonas terrae]|jgi:hypothetical protein|nr:PAS domain-containing protein [Parafilimonas terrae]
MGRFSPATIGADHEGVRATLDSADAVGRWHVNVRTGLVTADALVAFLFGFTAEQAEEGIDFVAFNRGVHPDDRACAMERIEHCVRDGGWFITEHRVCSADGQTRRILARGRFDKDQTGVVQSGSGIVVDITHGPFDEDPFFITRLSEVDAPLEHAADLILASHTLLKDAGSPLTLALVEALLMELGRCMAGVQGRARRSGLH